MTRIFKYTHREPGMWLGWLNNGQSVELSWGRHGWEFGGGVHVHNNDNNNGHRMLFLKFWRFTAVIPLGVIPGPYDVGEEPQWSAYVSREFGLTAYWGRHRWHKDFPWDFEWHRTSYLLADGTWLDELASDRPGINPKSPFKDNFTHYQHIHNQRKKHEWSQELPYSYTLRSGEVQNVTATITVREYERRRRFLRWTGFGAKVERCIDINFSDEVGERAGSWKGGTVGCGYTMLPDETPEQCLRRMERERKFG